MNTRERDRLRITRDVLKLVRRRDFRVALPPLGDGGAPIVVGLRDDTIDYIVKQLELMGGNAHIVVPPTKMDAWPSGMVLLQMQKGAEPAPPCDQMRDDECEVRPESELGMVVALLMRTRKPITFYICRRETTVELVDDGKEGDLVGC